MDPRSLRELAVDATSQLARVAIAAAHAATLARGTTVPTTTSSLMLRNLGNLAGASMSVSQTLLNIDGYELDSLSAELTDLLSYLEKYCMVRMRNSTTTTLKRLMAVLQQLPFKGTNITNRTAFYPVLQSARHPSRDKQSKLEGIITRFATTGGDELVTLLTKLDALKLKEPRQRSLVVENVEPPLEYDNELNGTLYTTLQHHSQCTCSINSSHISVGQRHQAWLRLSEKVQNHENAALFDVRFYVERKWFQTRFHVSEYKLHCHDL